MPNYNGYKNQQEDEFTRELEQQHADYDDNTPTGGAIVMGNVYDSIDDIRHNCNKFMKITLDRKMYLLWEDNRYEQI